MLLLFRFGYNHLKHQGYVTGLKGCYFCGLNPEEMSVTFGGILGSVVILVTMVPVLILKGRFNKEHRELTRGISPVTHFTDSRQYLAGSPPHHYQELTPFQQQQQFPTSTQPFTQFAPQTGGPAGGSPSGNFQNVRLGNGPVVSQNQQFGLTSQQQQFNVSA